MKSHCVNGFAGGPTVAGPSGSAVIVTGATNTAASDAGAQRSCNNTAPHTPTNLTATDGNQELDLIWTAPASDGGAKITDYEYEQNGSGSWTSTGGTATSYPVCNMNNGETYTFRVREAQQSRSAFD